MGDIHMYGNPHYWLSQYNAKIIDEDITQRLCELKQKLKEVSP
jgi:ABC-type Zn uptake system ZnuABC Zn-binding protein ZnuA